MSDQNFKVRELRKERQPDKLPKCVDCEQQHPHAKKEYKPNNYENESDEISSDESSLVESSDCGDSDSNDNCDDTNITSSFRTTKLGSQTSSNTEVSDITESLQHLLNIINKPNAGNVKVENSTHVHIGDITNINGNIQIIRTVNEAQSCRSNSLGQVHKRQRNKNKGNNSTAKPQKTSEHEENNQQYHFLQSTKFKVPKNLCIIIPRHTWLAQIPMEEYEYLERPVPMVIISHTATESSEIQAINIRIVRDIQCFHIESRGWNDIAYNFLIGCDGNVYEGRGWRPVGAHTIGYNNISIGISFIGCFMRDPPTAVALNACKMLLSRGIFEGFLMNDYRLVGHCQCRPTQSPGKKLYEEIQTWDHFSEPADLE